MAIHKRGKSGRLAKRTDRSHTPPSTSYWHIETGVRKYYVLEKQKRTLSYSSTSKAHAYKRRSEHTQPTIFTHQHKIVDCKDG